MRPQVPLNHVQLGLKFPGWRISKHHEKIHLIGRAGGVRPSRFKQAATKPARIKTAHAAAARKHPANKAYKSNVRSADGQAGQVEDCKRQSSGKHALLQSKAAADAVK